MSLRQRRRGSAIVEFVLCGIPMIFVWISVVQMSLGMWHYHTVQYATKITGTWVTHHGSSWVNSGNSPKTIGDAANVLATYAIGVPSSSITVTWTAGNSTVTCVLNACQSNTTVWPPAGQNGSGTDITIKTDWIFYSALAMVAPTATGTKVASFGSFHLPGYTRQFMLF